MSIGKHLLLLSLFISASAWGQTIPLAQRCGDPYDSQTKVGAMWCTDFDDATEVDPYVNTGGGITLPNWTPYYDAVSGVGGALEMLVAMASSPPGTQTMGGHWSALAIDGPIQLGETFTISFAVMFSTREKALAADNSGNPTGFFPDEPWPWFAGQSDPKKIAALWPKAKSCTNHSIVFSDGPRQGMLGIYNRCGTAIRCYILGAPGPNGSWCDLTKGSGAYYHMWDESTDKTGTQWPTNGVRGRYSSTCTFYGDTGCPWYPTANSSTNDQYTGLRYGDIPYFVTMQIQMSSVAYDSPDSKLRVWLREGINGETLQVMYTDEYNALSPQDGYRIFEEFRLIGQSTSYSSGGPDHYRYYDKFIFARNIGILDVDGEQYAGMLLQPTVAPPTPPPVPTVTDFTCSPSGATYDCTLQWTP